MLETLLDTEKEATGPSDKIQKIMINDNEFMEHLKERAEFNMSLKKAKRKLQIFLKYHPKMTNQIEIRRDFNRNDEVKLPKITFKTFSGDPLDWRSFKETFEAAVHNNESTPLF